MQRKGPQRLSALPTACLNGIVQMLGGIVSKVLAFFLALWLLEPPAAQAQTSQTWRSEASSGSWQGSTNWWNFPNGSPIVFGQQQWDNNHYLNQTNENGGSTFSTYRWLFQSGASSVHTFSGDAVRFFDFGGSDPQIINQSAATHVINMNLEGDGDSGDPLQIRIDNNSGGGLTFGGAISNQGSRLEVRGSATSAATVTFGGVISGSGGFYQENSNITALMTNANTYSGQTEVQAGTLRLAGSGSLANSAVRLHSGGTLSISNSATVSSVAEFASGNAGVIAISNGATLTVTANSLDIYQNSISGEGGLTKQGSHTLNLYGSQTYTGTTTVSAGQLATSVAMSSTNFTLTGGTFRTTSANVISDTAAITLGGGTASFGATETFGNSGVTLSSSTTSAVSVDGGVAATIGGTLSGSGNFTKSGAGTLVLSSSNTYSAGTLISGGVIEIRNNSALGTGAVTNAADGGGIFTDSTARTIANNVFIAADTLIGGTGALQIDGGTTLQVSSAITNNNSGGLTLSNVTLGNSGVSRTLNLRGTGNVTINGVIANSSSPNTGSLAISNSGVTTLNGNNTYSGTTRIGSGGFVVLGHSNAFGSTNVGTEITVNGGTIDVNGQTVTGEALTIRGTGAGGNGALRNAGAAPGAWNGLITLESTSYIGATNNTSLTVSNIAAGANELWVVGAGTTTIAGGATNSGSGTAFVKTNTGTAVLMASNAWSGNEFIREGTVVLSNNNALGAGGTTFVGATAGSAAATLRIGQGITNSNAITVEAGGTGARSLTYTEASGTGTQEGSITLSNSLAFNVATGGTLLFSGTVGMPASGTNVRLAVDGGGTLISTGNSAGANSNNYQVRIGNGTLIIGGGTLIARTNVAGLGHALDLGVDLDNSIVDAVSSLRASNGVTISNSIFASTTNNQGRVIGASGAGASAIFSGPIGLANAALTLDSTNGQTLTVSGAITNFSGTGSLTKTNDGLAILTGANTYSGATLVTNGTLRIASSSALGTTAAGTTVGSGAALELSNNINVVGEGITLHGTGVGGNGALRNVSGANTNTGTVTLGSSARINTDGGTLLLTGQIAGDVANALTVGGSGNTTLAAVTTAARALTKDGAGTLDFTTVTNTYGLVTISGGALRNNLDFYTSGLEGGSSGTLLIAAAGISNQFYADFGSATRTYSGAITGPGNFVKRGTGTQVLDGTYTSSGGLYVDAGVATLGTNVSGANYAATATHIGSVLAPRYGDSAELRIAGTSGGRTYTNALTVNTNTGSAVRLLSLENTSGTNTWSGGMAIAATNNGGLVISNVSGGTAVASGAVTGVGALSKNGGGMLILSGSNTHAGGTFLNSGVLRLDHVNAAGTGSVVQSSGSSTLQINAGGTITNNMSVFNVAFLNTGNVLTGTITNNNATYDVAGATTNEISGYLTGTGGVTKIGDGLLILSGSNDYSGATILSNGLLRLANSSAMGTGSLSQIDATSTLQVTNAITVTNNMSVYNVAFLGSSNTLSGEITNNNTTFDVATGNTNTITGRLSGPGGVTKTGGGGLIIAGANNNTYLGATVISNGALILSNSGGNAIHNSSGITVTGSGSSLVLGRSNMIGDGIGLTLDGGTFITGNSTAGYAETLGTLTLSSNSTIDLGSLAGGAGTRDITFANSSAISWTGTLTITNWQGVADTSGTAGRLFFGVGGLTSAQLAQIEFSGFGTGARLLGTGELTPIPEPRVYAAVVALLAAIAWRERRRWWPRRRAGVPSR